MVKGTRRGFICQECGALTPKWLGRCPECQAWNTLMEVAQGPERRPSSGAVRQAQLLASVSLSQASRLRTPLREMDRVLGGGLVPGSLVLLGGDPGIGKSTLLLQVAAGLARPQGNVTYISGEESAQQIKLRAERLGLSGEGLYLLEETDLEGIVDYLESAQPALVVIDSIQSVSLGNLASPPGSLAQVRECALRLLRWAKATQTPLFLIGHVTKDGSLAGPRTLEHIVDVVLYLEGEPFSPYRLLRGAKNRYGSTHEVGVFTMTEAGLCDVEDPSSVFLSERMVDAVGSCIVPALEGSRPLLLEIQALVSPSPFGMPRRIASGIDYNRLLLLVAVLTKRAGLALGNQDIVVNVVGGLQVTEPAADLAISLAIASSYAERPLGSGLIAAGEVGLSGELRKVHQLGRRLGEAAQLGFTEALVPVLRGGERLPALSTLHPVPAPALRDALRMALPTQNSRDR